MSCTWPGWCQCRHVLSSCSAPGSMYMALVFCLQMYVSEVYHCQLSCRLNCSLGSFHFIMRKPLFFLVVVICLSDLMSLSSNPFSISPIPSQSVGHWQSSHPSSAIDSIVFSFRCLIFNQMASQFNHSHCRLNYP